MSIVIENSQDLVRQNGQSIESFVELTSGIRFRNGIYIYDLVYYKSDVVRIHQFKKDEININPYSVVQEPLDIAITVKETGDRFIVRTQDLKVVIDRYLGTFSFYNSKGELINNIDPGLGIECQGTQKTVYNSLQPNEKFIGLGEKTGPLNKRGRGYQNWNTDSFAYTEESDPLYVSIPFYIGIHDQGTYGIFLDNSHKTHFNFGASNNRFSSFSMDDGDVDYYVFSGSVEKIIESYTWLTGRMPLPPLWSLGYQQCRYSYYPDQEVMNVASCFRSKNIPADVIVLDIHYMDSYKIFTWDEARFPNPQKMIRDLKDIGFEVVVICDPGIKIEDGYEAYDSGKDEEIFLKYPDGTNYEGEVWPGWCHFPDFTRESARAWWQKRMNNYTEMGLKGFWNDMNEIATWGQYLPENIRFSMEGNEATTRKGRNVYGMQMARSTYESSKDNLKGERPFVLSRAGFAGIQRYSALWTGDNIATNNHMLLGTRLVSNLGLSGVAYSGYDIGGFVGDSDSNLFARWIQLGAFSPFFRGHSNINSKASEPWSFGEEVEEIAGNYIRLRYKLMAYIYSSFLEASERGMPVIRSLAINYTQEETIYSENFDSQYLFGKSILVAPIESEERFRKIYLPEGKWYRFFTDETYSGNQQIINEYGIEELPLFVKSSSIIPVYPNAGKNVFERGDVLEVHLYKGDSPNIFEYYEDDGTSYAYEQGSFHRRKISYNPAAKELIFDKSQGDYNSSITQLRCVFHGFSEGELENIRNTNFETYSFVDPISDFDPFDNAERKRLSIDKVQTFSLDYSSEQLVFNW